MVLKRGRKQGVGANGSIFIFPNNYRIQRTLQFSDGLFTTIKISLRF